MKPTDINPHPTTSPRGCPDPTCAACRGEITALGMSINIPAGAIRLSPAIAITVIKEGLHKDAARYQKEALDAALIELINEDEISAYMLPDNTLAFSPNPKKGGE